MGMKRTDDFMADAHAQEVRIRLSLDRQEGGLFQHHLNFRVNNPYKSMILNVYSMGIKECKINLSD